MAPKSVWAPTPRDFFAIAVSAGGYLWARHIEIAKATSTMLVHVDYSQMKKDSL